jgi:hypothetical protein
VVHRHPIELGAEIGLYLAHRVAGETAKVREAVALATLGERLAVFLVVPRPVGLTTLAVTGVVPSRWIQRRWAPAAERRHGASPNQPMSSRQLQKHRTGMVSAIRLINRRAKTSVRTKTYRETTVSSNFDFILQRCKSSSNLRRTGTAATHRTQNRSLENRPIST